jgi:1-acyl-sn-glycerol-3-phosphate acyltransferase
MKNPMKTAIVTILNCVYIPYLLVISIIYELLVPFYMAVFILFRRGRLDDAFRHHNWMYGNYLVRLSWPFIRIRLRGREHMPTDRPLVFTLNHRTYADIFFSSLIPEPNQLVTARSWVFDLKLFGWAMKLARYNAIENLSAKELLAIGRSYAPRGVSFQFYPEGHRSRTGKLQRFRTGPFLLALDNDLPVVPVCMTGIEKFVSSRFPFFHPVKVDITILRPVYPGDFEHPQRALKMRKHVKQAYREFLGQ